MNDSAPDNHGAIALELKAANEEIEKKIKAARMPKEARKKAEGELKKVASPKPTPHFVEW